MSGGAGGPAVDFTLDGRAVRAAPGETLLDVARREGITIPTLCWQDGLAPAGNCRACVVEVEGERVLAAACCRHPAAGMVVRSASERARASQRLVLELLQSDLPGAALAGPDEVGRWAEWLGVAPPRFDPRASPPADRSHPAIAVRMEACIQCTRCLRACRDVQGNDVIGLARRGADARIVFDLDDPMGLSSCVGCGECVQACPTGALAPAAWDGALAPAAWDGAPAPASWDRAPTPVPDRSVDTLCPYCGVGCQLTLHVKDQRVLWVDGRDGPANRGRLCVKGRYGVDYPHHPHRLTVPLVRRDGAAKQPDAGSDTVAARAQFREATWEEALDRAGAAFVRLRDTHGPGVLAGFGSAKGSNEEAYLFQKLVRLGFGSNHVDHCTRLCHASSVAALLEGIGSGAVSNPVRDVEHAECVIVIGANPTVNHPVAATWIK
ncbi:MAG: 2Fe-2S iron-sulfur cluster-binding protein, partial [Rubrivivax sp.]